jgi:hypothetical protein
VAGPLSYGPFWREAYDSKVRLPTDNFAPARNQTKQALGPPSDVIVYLFFSSPAFTIMNYSRV